MLYIVVVANTLVLQRQHDRVNVMVGVVGFEIGGVKILGIKMAGVTVTVTVRLR